MEKSSFWSALLTVVLTIAVIVIRAFDKPTEPRPLD
jgi:hypothetical protein